MRPILAEYHFAILPSRKISLIWSPSTIACASSVRLVDVAKGALLLFRGPVAAPVLICGRERPPLSAGSFARRSSYALFLVCPL